MHDNPTRLLEWPGLGNRKPPLRPWEGPSPLQGLSLVPIPALRASGQGQTQGLRTDTPLGQPHSRHWKHEPDQPQPTLQESQAWRHQIPPSQWKTAHRALTRLGVGEGFLKEAVLWKKKFGAVRCWTMLGPKKTKKKICNTKPLYLNFGYFAYPGFFSLKKKIAEKYLPGLPWAFWSPAPPYFALTYSASLAPH